MNILFNALQVSDVNDDVRRAAVESLGFILFRYCTFLSHFHSLCFGVVFFFSHEVCAALLLTLNNSITC